MSVKIVDSSGTSAAPRQRNKNLKALDEEEGGMDQKDVNRLSPMPRSAGVESSQSRRARLYNGIQEITVSLDQGFQENKEELVKFWDQFTRKGKPKVGVLQSLKALFWSSWLNIFLLVIPVAWVSHFKEGWSDKLTFVLCFFAIVPLERLFDYGGEQMSFYLGKELGDLVVVTLNNAVEATLAIILLLKCELILLKSTIVGVVILHLLLVPGTAFVIGGARVIQQDLHPHLTQLNHSLLTLGVLTLLIPAAFFAAIDTQFTLSPGEEPTSIVTDPIRGNFLRMSRGLAIVLLIVYIGSRIYLHNPPGEENALSLANAPLAPEAFKEHVQKFKDEDPEVNQYVCIAMLCICIALMAATAEFLVESIEFVREEAGIQIEWFGLILLPFVSFAADGVVAVVYFVRYMFRHFFREPTPPTTLAKGEAIDLSIQFTLFWMPLLVLIGWWKNRPLNLLFETFEVAILIGACFLVNYVTADSKTNWAEGMTMVAFYVMIAICSWFYTGEEEVRLLSYCGLVSDTIAQALNHTLPE
ncbi:hypothetical protein CPC08DRAFT_701898 [Agrocybe pediades]|nr:hypothetical protein CPC08DRAFT_701898 [Agrocybe pediades]